MPKNDDFDDESFFDKGADFFRDVTTSELEKRWPAHIKFLFFLIIIFFISAIYWSLTQSSDEDMSAELSNLPKLSPTQTAFRARPETRGGMDIPNKDSTLYEAIEGNDAQKSAPDNAVETGQNQARPEKALSTEEKEPSQNVNDRFAGLEQTLKQELQNDSGNVLEQEDSQAKEDINETGTDNKAQQNATRSDNSALPQVKLRPRQEDKDDIQDTKDPQDVENLADLSETQSLNKSKTPENVSKKPEIKDSSKESSLKTLSPRPKPDKAQENTDLNKREDAENTDELSNEKENTLKGVINSLANDKKELNNKTSAESKPQGNYFVQLGSVSSQSRAEAEWKRLRTKYDNILTLDHKRIQRADLGSRGVFYRIQAGPVSKKAANNICDKLKNAGKPGGCLVVRK